MLFRSELNDIPGIGEATAMELLRVFKSVQKIKSASLDQLEEVVGKSKAGKVFNYFSGQAPKEAFHTN